METMQDIRNRLKSISSTKQITESMRLISTSKVQKARQRMIDNRTYLTQSIRTVKHAVNSIQTGRHLYITGRKVQKSLIIVISGDRGLCGGYNISVEKAAFGLAEELGESQIIAIGSKARDYLRRRNQTIIQSYTGLSENPFYEEAQQIGMSAINMFDEKIIDQIYLVYTEYNSMLSQAPKAVRLLPLDIIDINEAKPNRIMRNEPSDELFLKNSTSIYICAAIFGAMLESAVSEQCARITGMDSAAKNSDKIMDSLALRYNQMRQGSITQEIAEIVGGAEAITQSGDVN